VVFNLSVPGLRSFCIAAETTTSDGNNVVTSEADSTSVTMAAGNAVTPVHNTSHSHSLRPYAYDRELPGRLTHLTDCNFIIRMLFYQVKIDTISLFIYTFLY